jgi:hypothetical protein
MALFETRGSDVNQAAQRIKMIRKTVANEQEPQPLSG